MAEVLTVPDTCWDADTAERISRLRTERRALLCHLAEHSLCKTTWKRISHLNTQLYKITGYEIYNPLNHGTVSRS